MPRGRSALPALISTSKVAKSAICSRDAFAGRHSRHRLDIVALEARTGKAASHASISSDRHIDLPPTARDRSALVLCNRHRFVELRYRARRRRYIGDKGHEVRPSLMRKAAIDCSLFPDASDFVRCWRRWVRRDWRRLDLSMRVRTPAFRASNTSQQYTDDLLIKGQDK